MDQDLNNRQNEILLELLANPANAGQTYSYDLQQLVNEYPQSGILKAMLVHAGAGNGLKQVATYFDPHLLYKLMHDADSLATVTPEQIVTDGYAVTLDHHSPPPVAENYFNIGPAVEIETAEKEYQPDDDEQHFLREDNYLGEQVISVEESATSTVLPVAEDKSFLEENKAAVPTPSSTEADIEDEVYDEIVGIENISFSGPAHETTAEMSEADEKDKFNEPGIDLGSEKWIIGSIASIDYFTFDNSAVDQKNAGETLSDQSNSTAVEMVSVDQNGTTADTESQDVSKYNDEKMPYTFMWWLDKTRKEYAATYQPYTSPLPSVHAQPAELKEQASDALQQQYFENIFHVKSLEELEKTPQADAPEVRRKEDVIIERFIQEEPQIRPPAMDKLDNENKAKKSAEDRNDLVSETLAHIYADQMLYHKAIATYKKLMVKFPEKSRYFAIQIEQLEKKTN
ncbi:hypothetical protein [Mucilaginibacter sp. SP1R1]|uniref:hypothetical protein n=1 Tax=Mucilaginibacter sp. SP1R1 TaxID=2723091 RepID=UPI001616A267|nr:hypothetical protein [Mucilaginibacter sp. SP1R1]MBB6151256.1 hypothetical protein [Mucilaginibacter sp. SP1R1]